eukprot:GHVH01001038.1.p1 GENE.GHVH01001038.1~~GHVH01001038.1.p1  ORF type:complete len:244 (+),score=15.97 GHVH01001038.1:957-1688(+)
MRGVDGLCPSCKLMCIKFIDENVGRVSNQVKAVNYALANNAKVSNNSYGGYGFSNAEYQGLRRASAAGHIMVSSSGNRGRNNDNFQSNGDIHTPSDYSLPYVLSVGASNHHGNNAHYSNYGKSSVDLHAPGSNIVTTANQFQYRAVCGTSFAAPMVTGTIGLILSENPSLHPSQVLQSLSCRQVPQLKQANACGGVLDVTETMNRAKLFEEANKIDPKGFKGQPNFFPYLSSDWNLNRAFRGK